MQQRPICHVRYVTSARRIKRMKECFFFRLLKHINKKILNYELLSRRNVTTEDSRRLISKLFALDTATCHLLKH